MILASTVSAKAHPAKNAVPQGLPDSLAARGEALAAARARLVTHLEAPMALLLTVIVIHEDLRDLRP